VALDQAQAEYEIIDIFRTPLSVADLRDLLGSRTPTELFSWKSPQARLRGVTPGSRSDEQLLRLMAEEPRLIRRPLVRIGGQLVIGSDPARITELLAASS
jgi:arsenate reductase-like glutaredoxin family protein